MYYAPYNGTGRLEVIAGCMFSGKTEELLRRMRRAQIARQPTLLVKPARDVRYAEDSVVSHDANALRCVALPNAAALLKACAEAAVIGIDEAQFFDGDLTSVVACLVREGKRVIVAGLDLDYRGTPFGPMPALLAMAEEVIKVAAVCTVCGAPAYRSQRLVPSDEQVLLGASDNYAARCGKHWDPERFHAEQQDLPLR